MASEMKRRLAPERAELPLELIWRIFDHLPNNVTACTIRPLCKACSQRYSGPQHRRVSQAQPVPPHAFAWRYLSGPAAEQTLKRLSVKRRHRLFAIAAAGGSTGNLTALLERMGGHFLTPFGDMDDEERAASDAAAAAARHGHIDVMCWLHGRSYPMLNDPALCAMVQYRSLAEAKWFLQLRPWHKLTPAVLAAAAASTTPDAAAKLDWLLEEQRCPVSVAAVEAAARRDDLPSVQRLMKALADAKLPARPWARDSLPDEAVPCAEAAAAAGASSVLSWVLQQHGKELCSLRKAAGLSCLAAEHGHIPLLEQLLTAAQGERDHEPQRLLCSCLVAAAYGGRVAVLQHLWDRGGRLEVPEQRAPAGWRMEEAVDRRDEAFGRAAGTSGCVEAARWLLQRGCGGQGRDKALCQAVSRGDLAMAAFLLDEVGVPWAKGQAMLKAAVKGTAAAGPHVLRWLLERGCPLLASWEGAARAAEYGELETLSWMLERLGRGCRPRRRRAAARRWWRRWWRLATPS